MKSSISEVVGRTEDPLGKGVAVYCALRSLICAKCGADIKEGELFTRRKLGGINISPHCSKCYPFKLQPQNRSDSSLLRSFLDAPTTGNSSDRTRSLPDRQAIAKEVERRLGPALAFSRKRRR
jgi:hypothetical protein